MFKNFDEWNRVKKDINFSYNFPYFKEREIWFVNLGQNIGHEQNGKGDNFLRPVIIFKKFNYRLFWGLPLTRKYRSGKYYYNFKLNDKNNSVILSQLRSIDVKRLRYKIGYIPKNDYIKIIKKLSEIFPRVF